MMNNNDGENNVDFLFFMILGCIWELEIGFLSRYAKKKKKFTIFRKSSLYQKGRREEKDSKF